MSLVYKNKLPLNLIHLPPKKDKLKNNRFSLQSALQVSSAVENRNSFIPVHSGKQENQSRKKACIMKSVDVNLDCQCDWIGNI